MLFQSMFLLCSWHKWLLFLYWKQGKLFITLCYFQPSFYHFLDINDFCFPSGSSGSCSEHFPNSIHVFSIFLKQIIFVFVMDSGKVIHNTLLFQSRFLLCSWHKWLLFFFIKQGKLFITVCYFNPSFSYVLDMNDFLICSGSRGSYF